MNKKRKVKVGLCSIWTRIRFSSACVDMVTLEQAECVNKRSVVQGGSGQPALGADRYEDLC